MASSTRNGIACDAVRSATEQETETLKQLVAELQLEIYRLDKTTKPMADICILPVPFSLAC
jgi:hypothetical protein